MNSRMRLLLPILLYVALGAAAAEPPAGPTPEQLAGYVQDLKADALPKRVTATANLREAGETARTVLEAAAKSADAETKSRAARLLAVLDAQIFLDKARKTLAEKPGFAADIAYNINLAAQPIETLAKYRGTSTGEHFFMESLVKIADQHSPQRLVSDGTHVWFEIGSIAEGATDTKKMLWATFLASQRFGWSTTPHPLLEVWHLSQDFDLIERSEHDFDGIAAVVLEGPAREDLAEVQKRNEDLGGMCGRTPLFEVKRVRLFLGKDDLLPRRIEWLPAKGEPIAELSITNIERNPPPKDDQYTYTLPDHAIEQDVDESLQAIKKMQEEQKPK